IPTSGLEALTTPPTYFRSHQCIFGPTRTFLIPPAHFQLHPPSLPVFEPTGAFLVPPICFQPHAHVFNCTLPPACFRPRQCISSPMPMFSVHLSPQFVCF
ncbi:hypothetical protein PAXRUDRAFT_762946, partial [Paxillus rubicundulus Ve08.2h10]